MAGGVGDMSSQYISQYHPAHIYPEQGELESGVPGYTVILVVFFLLYLFSALYLDGLFTHSGHESSLTLLVA